MMRDTAIAAATEGVERGWLPDAMVRWGIRQLCARRLAEPRRDLLQFIDGLRDTEIAPCAAAANAQHYELPPECFERMLGPRLKYSACWWGRDDIRTLADAEDAALALTAAHAGVEDGMQILELGCGWGSLTLWMAERYPRARIVALSNSASQRGFIEARARQIGVANVSVITADMNTFDTEARFDRIVSVEMFEHMRNYHALLAKVRRWLDACGRLFVHVFCHHSIAYPFDTDGASNWMGRHFFTGGLMPSAQLLPKVPSPFEVEEQWAWDGTHYQRTAEAWLRNVDERRDELALMFARTYGRADAPRWLQRWRVFLMACAELFGYRGGTEWGVAHYRFAPAEGS